MGQKANVLTLRKKNKNLSFLGNEKESRKLLCGLNFLKFLDQLLKRKNIILTDKTLNFDKNQSYLNLTLFFKTAKLLNYKRKISKKWKTSNCNTKATRFLIKEFSLLKSNLISLRLKVINKKINKELVRFFYHKLKRFSGLLFSRRFNFFIDFLKASSLFSEDLLPIQAYLSFFGQIFRVLQKRTHSRFLLFLKIVFDLMVINTKIKRVSEKSNVKGLRFVLNGKLKGKPRASSACGQFGCVPISTIAQNIAFAKLHIYTLYGVFGLRAWVHRN